VAVSAPLERPSVDELLRRADVAMYNAKGAGKHRLAIYTGEAVPAAAPAPAGRSVRHNRAPRATSPA
jgi:predicted signal transduction protein with EAL and GGDEF domain